MGSNQLLTGQKTFVHVVLFFRSKWNSNPHFCGSYTIASIEEEENNASAEDLARPISSKSRNDVLLFAGESTHSTHFATVHGAIETGYREAQRLIQMYQETNP